MTRRIALCAALLLGGATAGVYGDDPTNPAGIQAALVSHRDQMFVQTATQAGAAEVRIAELALLKTANEDVKHFAQTMQDDHTKANEALRKLTLGKNIPLDTLNNDNKTFDKLSKMEGAAFDHAYIDDQVKVHQDAVSLFQNEADKGDDSDLKTFAATTLPALTHHLEMVKDLQLKLNATTGNK